MIVEQSVAFVLCRWVFSRVRRQDHRFGNVGLFSIDEFMRDVAAGIHLRGDAQLAFIDEAVGVDTVYFLGNASTRAVAELARAALRQTVLSIGAARSRRAAVRGGSFAHAVAVGVVAVFGDGDAFERCRRARCMRLRKKQT